MRAYFFGNMYLSSIQQGIQAQHCTVELYNNYAPQVGESGYDTINPDRYEILVDWATKHKTSILLNAGYSSTLRNIYKELSDFDNPYPFAKFHESEEALDNALTCVCIVIPAAIYETASEVRNAFRERGAKRGRDDIANFEQYGEWVADNGMENYTFTKFQVWLITELNKYGLAK